MKTLAEAIVLGAFLFVVSTFYTLAYTVLEVALGSWLIARSLLVMVLAPLRAVPVSIDAARRYACGEPLESILAVAPGASPSPPRVARKTGSAPSRSRWGARRLRAPYPPPKPGV